MRTDLLNRVERPPTPPVAPGPTADPVATPAGVALVGTWLTFHLYALWLSASGPEHPDAPAWQLVFGAAVFYSAMAATAGLLARRRWALVLSCALALPMVGLAVFCVLADAGNHWIAESAIALGVVVFSLHPQSWRMHRR